MQQIQSQINNQCKKSIGTNGNNNQDMQQNNSNEFKLNEFNNNQVNTPTAQNGVSTAIQLDFISKQR